MDSEHKFFKGFSYYFKTGWIVKTVFALIFGLIVGFFLVGQLFFCTRNVAMELAGTFFMGATIGLFVGKAQSSQLKNILRNPKVWVVANIAGWGIAIFLCEIFWPISSCLATTNGPYYSNSHLYRTLQPQLYELAELVEKTIVGEMINGDIYNGAKIILACLLVGVNLGVPQGIGQWLALRKDLPGVSNLIWINVLLWGTTISIAESLIYKFHFIGFRMWFLILILLILTAAVTAFVLDRLRKKKMGNSYTQ